MLGELGDPILGLALSVPRVAAAFMVLPLLTEQSIPAMARNGFFVALGLVAFPIAAASAPTASLGVVDWPFLVLREIFIGVCIGFAFSAVFWALAAAGNLIDATIGTNMPGVIDPLAGHDDTLHGAFLSRLATWLFLASGAFTLFLDLLFGSYLLWPPGAEWPSLPAEGANLFIDRFGWMMAMALLLAAPALVLLAMVDLALGLLNRFAPQLNMFALNMSIKSWLATLMLVLGLGAIAGLVAGSIADGVAAVRALRGAIPAP